MLAPSKIYDFITEARQRGLRFSTLTNFSYVTKAQIEKLHALAGDDPESMVFYANISAATPETYQKIRPNQSKATFEKVVNILISCSIVPIVFIITRTSSYSGTFLGQFSIICV